MKKSIFLFQVLLHCAMSYEIVPILSQKFITPYSPYWDQKTQSLFFTDFLNDNFSIARFDYKSGKFFTARIIGETMPLFIIPIKGCINQYAIGFAHAVKIIQWDGFSSIALVIRTAFEVENDAEYAQNHWHMARADPKNRFYGSTYRSAICSNSSAAPGAFYRYTKRRGPRRILKGINVASGLEWNIKKKKFYAVDSCKLKVREYDWNAKSGAICNGRTIYNFYDGGTLPQYVPTGLTIDCAGHLYVAAYNGSSVFKIDPETKTLLHTFSMPIPTVTGTAFGGPDLKTLFVTSAQYCMGIYSGTIYNASNYELAGSIFMIKGLDSCGVRDRKLCL